LPILFFSTYTHTPPSDFYTLSLHDALPILVGTVNANREYFEMGVRDMSQAEAEYPGWLSRLLTDRVRGLENYTELFNKLTNPNGDRKSTRLNSSHVAISYAVFCLKKKNKKT